MQNNTHLNTRKPITSHQNLNYKTTQQEHYITHNNLTANA